MKSSGLTRLSLVGERSEVRRKEGRKGGMKGGMKGQGKGGEESSCILLVEYSLVLLVFDLEAEALTHRGELYTKETH